MAMVAAALVVGIAEDIEALVCGQHHTASSVRYRHYQALRFSFDTLTVGVVSRYLLPECRVLR